MPKPPEVPTWATDPSATIITPSVAKRALGWIVELPPHEFFNWLGNRTGQWLAYVNSAFRNVSSFTYATDIGLSLGGTDASLVVENPSGDTRYMRFAGDTPIITAGLRADELDALVVASAPLVLSDECASDSFFFDRAQAGVFTNYAATAVHRTVTFEGGVLPSRVRAGTFNVQGLNVAPDGPAQLTSIARANIVKATGVVRPVLGTVDGGVGAYNLSEVSFSGNRVSVSFSTAFDTVPRVAWGAYDNVLASNEAFLCVPDAQLPQLGSAACYVFTINVTTGAIAPHTPTGNFALTLIAT